MLHLIKHRDNFTFYLIMMIITSDLAHWIHYHLVYPVKNSYLKE